MSRTFIALFGAGIVLTGCYTYVPASLDTLQPGASVRLELSPEGSEHAQAPPGSPVTATVSEVSAGELLFLMRGPATSATGSGGREVRLRPSDISAVEANRFSGRRTAIFAAAVGFVVGLSFYLIHVNEPGGSSPPPGGGVGFDWIPAIP